MNKCKRCGQVAWLNTLHKGVCYSCHEAEAVRVVEDANAGVLRHRQRVQAIKSASMDEFITGDTGYVMEQVNRMYPREYLVDFGYRHDYVVVFAPADGLVEVVPLLDLFVVEWNERECTFTLERKVRQRKAARR